MANHNVAAHPNSWSLVGRNPNAGKGANARRTEREDFLVFPVQQIFDPSKQLEIPADPVARCHIYQRITAQSDSRGVEEGVERRVLLCAVVFDTEIDIATPIREAAVEVEAGQMACAANRFPPVWISGICVRIAGRKLCVLAKVGLRR